MTFHEFATLASLALTPMTVYASAIVIWLWWSPFVRSLKDNERTAVGWMIVGVVINFTGAIFDNLWWGVAWSADFVNHTSDIRDYFFKNGVYSNTVFRQSMGFAGAICHIYSGSMTNEKWLKRCCYGGAMAGVLWVILLVYVKNS